MMDDPAVVLENLWLDGAPRIDEQVLHRVPVEIRKAIKDSIDSSTKLYRYVLPTQLLAKATDPSRHCLALQAQADLPGSYDARSFCTRFIVPFDRRNDNVLGGSGDPGVGNIWRYPLIDEEWISRRKDKAGAELLCLVLTYAQEHPEQIEGLLRLVLMAVADRLARTRIVYPTPNRISLEAAEKLVDQFLHSRTGGRRLQAIASALFDTIGERFGLYNRVEVGHVNKADRTRGDVADLNCFDAAGVTVLSVEVKDRRLNIREVQDTLRAARESGVGEILYLIRGGVEAADVEAFENLKSRQFIAGHNLYDIEFEGLLHACLILFGERGRRTFLEVSGRRIDEFGELTDRQAWRSALEQL